MFSISILGSWKLKVFSHLFRDLDQEGRWDLVDAFVASPYWLVLLAEWKRNRPRSGISCFELCQDRAQISPTASKWILTELINFPVQDHRRPDFFGSPYCLTFRHMLMFHLWWGFKIPSLFKLYSDPITKGTRKDQDWDRDGIGIRWSVSEWKITSGTLILPRLGHWTGRLFQLFTFHLKGKITEAYFSPVKQSASFPSEILSHCSFSINGWSEIKNEDLSDKDGAHLQSASQTQQERKRWIWITIVVSQWWLFCARSFSLQESEKWPWSWSWLEMSQLPFIQSIRPGSSFSYLDDRSVKKLVLFDSSLTFVLLIAIAIYFGWKI